jgi:hypothetical protein
MCPLLAPIFQGFFFLQWPLTVLMKQTRQAVCAFKQSILLRCLWIILPRFELIWRVHQLTDFLAQKDQSIFVLMSAFFSPKVHFQFSNKSPTKSKAPTFHFFKSCGCQTFVCNDLTDKTLLDIVYNT